MLYFRGIYQILEYGNGKLVWPNTRKCMQIHFDIFCLLSKYTKLKANLHKALKSLNQM